jgi:hypothetical protein
MEQALSTLSVLPATKKEREHFIGKVIAEVQSGERNPIEAHVLLNNLKTLAAELAKNEDFKEAVISTLMHYDGNKTGFGDFEISLTCRKSFDFETCEDSEWERLDAEIKSLNVLKKERESFLKTIKQPIGNIETGEVIHPPAYTSTEVITVKERRAK